MGLDREKLIAWLETEATNHREAIELGFSDGVSEVVINWAAGMVIAYNQLIEKIDAGDFDD